MIGNAPAASLQVLFFVGCRMRLKGGVFLELQCNLLASYIFDHGFGWVATSEYFVCLCGDWCFEMVSIDAFELLEFFWAKGICDERLVEAVCE
jgi:hypothetical protein